MGEYPALRAIQPPAEAVTVFAIIEMDIRTLKAVAREASSTDSEIRALLPGFPCMKRLEKPTKNAKTMRNSILWETTRARIAKSLHADPARVTGLRPILSARIPQTMSPAAVLRLMMLWITPSPTTLTPVLRM